MAQGILNSSSAPDNLELFTSKTLRNSKMGLSVLMRIQLSRQFLDGGRKIFVLLLNQGETRVLQRQEERKEEGGAWIALMVGTGRLVSEKFE